ncbi:hypothetical protein CDL12_22483 [Handroanthus impetiginosus]|uniref:DUF247 domain-containing protein n=1 Tax=Handroanthus impetiginosus TaxID=429701 RepID=A0A2G9GI71_9LAMI|nr:hypothetical protein CDL12_22483 [Handroanthus impetiginosus]
MMLLDSCFLIYVICITAFTPRAPHEGHPEYLNVFFHLDNLENSLILEDVFLMENQIPFKILMDLITSRYDNGEELVSKFLQISAWIKFDEQRHEDIKQQLKESPPLHLLEALRTVFVWDKTSASLEQLAQNYIDEQGNVDVLKHEKTFRSAKDLKAKGIHFRSSSRKSFKAINFKSFTFYGQLELPSSYVSNLLKVTFLNLIAYELCQNNPVDLTVISYVTFMKSLIVGPAHVKELREKRILLTSWTDEDVVRFYKDLDTFDFGGIDIYMYVKQKIQEHYDSKAKTWMAELFNTYFSSPWSIIAWVGAVFVLVLTVLQTYFTINPRSDSRQ